MEGLTAKQEIFVQELIKGKSQRQAYLTAYPKSKNWKKSAVDTTAAKLLKIPKVFQRYEELKKDSVNKSADDATSMANFLIGEYKTIADADIGDYYETNVDSEGRITLDVVDLSKVNTRAIQEISFSGSKVKIKLYSKTDAMKALADIYGINNKVDAEVSIVIKDDFEGMCD